MLWQRIRFALLTGALVAMTGLAWAAEEEKDAPKGEKIAPPAEKAPAPPATCTVWVNEYVQEQVPCTRTVYKRECKTEEYTAYKTECVPEVRTRNVTTYRKVCETVNETRCVCVTVPCVEERTIMKKCTVCKPVTHCTRKCEDHGHYECKEVCCGPSFFDTFKAKCGHKDCCDPCATECCAPVRTKTVKVWVPCKVWVEHTCTKMERVTECHPEVCKVTVCKKEFKTEVCPVTRVRCIPECKAETYTCNVTRCVPYKATRTVEVCVPHTETVMVTRCVCKKVARQVTCAPCCETSCNACDSCGSKHKFFHN